MAVTDRIKTYDIDLGLPEGERWLKVMEAEYSRVGKLCDQALEQFPRHFKAPWFTPAKEMFRWLYQVLGGRYLKESDSWAKKLGYSKSDLLLLQCSYELGHVSEQVAAGFPKIGCTAGIHFLPGKGMVHVRNMDWPLSQVGRCTRLFRFHRKEEDHSFVAVGVSGLVGVLSGMVPNAYSVTINFAPPAERPTVRNFGPLFLLREVFETCKTYTDAVNTLSHTKLSCGVIFTVCGARDKQGCVIERTKTDFSTRRYRGKPICAANHYSSRKFKRFNDAWVEDEEGESVFHGSSNRQAVLESELSKVKRGLTLEEVADVLDVEPVYNEESYQQMAFCPATGEVKVWRWA